MFYFDKGVSEFNFEIKCLKKVGLLNCKNIST